MGNDLGNPQTQPDDFDPGEEPDDADTADVRIGSGSGTNDDGDGEEDGQRQDVDEVAGDDREVHDSSVDATHAVEAAVRWILRLPRIGGFYPLPAHADCPSSFSVIYALFVFHRSIVLGVGGDRDFGVEFAGTLLTPASDWSQRDVDSGIVWVVGTGWHVAVAVAVAIAVVGLWDLLEAVFRKTLFRKARTPRHRKMRAQWLSRMGVLLFLF